MTDPAARPTRLGALNTHRIRPPSASLERLALGLGLASALCLAVAAFVVFSNPRGAAWSHIDDLCTRAKRNVRDVWDSMLVIDPFLGDQARYLDPQAELVELDPSSELDSTSPPVALPPDPIDDKSVFEVLLSESERVELIQGRMSDALSLASEACMKQAPAGRRALARLRAIQLAAALDDRAVVQEQWNAAVKEIEPALASGDTSTLLLCALAALPKLDPNLTGSIVEHIASLWAANKLVLPNAQRRFERVEDPQFGTRTVYRTDARETALRERFLACAANDAELLGRFSKLDAAWKRRAFAEMGGLPTASSISRERWTLSPLAAGLIAERENSTGRRVLQFATQRAVEDAMKARVRAQNALPARFALDLNGESSSLGERVGTSFELDRAFPRATLRHPDLESALTEVESRTLWLRAGLLVLAVFVAGAAFATHHALRRERRLAEARSTFVANVSHELRTPLAALLLMAENLESGRAGSDPTRYHALIKREVLRLRRLVEDALDFSRLERGKRFQTHIEDVDLAAWFAGLCLDGCELAMRAGLELECSSTIGQQHAFFDGEALRRAALNLIDNALRHSGSREISLALEVSPVRLTLSVSDHGRGIPPRQREAVFEPFLRLAGSEHTTGAGLGLAIVREIAVAHGGSVRVRDATPGPGVVFEIEIPLTQSAVDEGAVSA